MISENLKIIIGGGIIGGIVGAAIGWLVVTL